MANLQSIEFPEFGARGAVTHNAIIKLIASGARIADE